MRSECLQTEICAHKYQLLVAQKVALRSYVVSRCWKCTQFKIQEKYKIIKWFFFCLHHKSIQSEHLERYISGSKTISLFYQTVDMNIFVNCYSINFEVLTIIILFFFRFVSFSKWFLYLMLSHLAYYKHALTWSILYFS